MDPLRQTMHVDIMPAAERIGSHRVVLERDQSVSRFDMGDRRAYDDHCAFECGTEVLKKLNSRNDAQ